LVILVSGVQPLIGVVSGVRGVVLKRQSPVEGCSWGLFLVRHPDLIHSIKIPKKQTFLFFVGLYYQFEPLTHRD